MTISNSSLSCWPSSLPFWALQLVTVSKTTFGRTSPYLMYLVVTMPHGSHSLGETAAKQKGGQGCVVGVDASDTS
jgi:hypothetical protein